MFYLKYRPKTLDEVDNSKVKEVIKQILNTGNFPHALLFVGQKGTGKTSVARIFAKAVNCTQKKERFEPCNKCKNCQAIDTSTSTDVVEMDAASNRGIDEIRNIIREASFSPMTSSHRIFIVDEAHMITNDAFNALLKTLEEPPPSVIFILVTTNEEKIPKTIASRCLIVNFGKGKKADIILMLKRILEKEKLKVDSKLLDLIAKHAENSFRDAAKIFEELIIQKKLSFEDARAFLGIIGKEDLLELIQDKTLKDVLGWIEEFSQKGGSFKNLIEELLEELRICLLNKNGVKIDTDMDLKFSNSEISTLMKLLNEAYVNLRSSPIESIPLEIAVVEFYNGRNKSKVHKVESF